MYQRYYSKLCLYIVACLLPYWATAQDLHFSHFRNAPLNLNPALTGAFKGNIRAGSTYRSQWYSRSDGDIYTTFSGFGAIKLGKMALGLLLNYDESGAAALNNKSMTITGAYSCVWKRRHLLSFGFATGGTESRYTRANLTFKDQYINGRFNANAPTQEPITNERATFFSMNWGANYTYQGLDRTQIQTGVGVNHFNEPTFSFNNNNNSVIERRFSVYALGLKQMTSKLDLLVDGLFQKQGSYNEFVGSVGIRWHLKETLLQESWLQTGVAARFGDSFSPFFGLGYNQWQVNFNFDVTTSIFSNATKQGGPEFSLIYTYRKVQPKSFCLPRLKYL
jgi:type IX secretion system PorP/SprF family membrane protein